MGTFLNTRHYKGAEEGPRKKKNPHPPQPGRDKRQPRVGRPT